MSHRTTSAVRRVILALICITLVPMAFPWVSTSVQPYNDVEPNRMPLELVSGVAKISLATISGTVVVGPPCPVEFVERPCPVLDLSNRFLVLTPVPTGGQVRIQLSSDGGFEETVLPGTYIIILQPCSELGCSRVFPQEISLAPGSATVFDFEINGGVR